MESRTGPALAASQPDDDDGIASPTETSTSSDTNEPDTNEPDTNKSDTNKSDSSVPIVVPSGKTAPADSKMHSCKCPPPPPDKKKIRNLVVCIDGTANQFSINVRQLLCLSVYFIAQPSHFPQNTHVVELYSRLEKDDSQLTYYDSGIGTFVKRTNWFWWLIQLIVHIWDMMVAWCVLAVHSPVWE